MVEDDTFTYHIKQPPREHINEAQENTAVHALITKERTQKLDLLIHLLSNLPQSLIVCGPEGIGKTTLLTLLQQRNTDLWRYCLVQGHADVSFETIQKPLIEALSDRQHKQVVLVIDNAGDLVPGLISAIIQYAAANPALRVIFALTHDEVQVKRGSDKAIDDCHMVEIPTLSEKQCGDFLQHLSTKPALNVSFKAITENMTAHIYRETHGVPGRIIANVSGLSGTKKTGKWGLVLAIAAAIAIMFGVQWQVSKKTVEPVAVEQKSAATEVVAQKPESQIMLTLPLNPAPAPSESQTPVLSKVEVPVLDKVEVSVPNKAETPVLSKVEVPVPGKVEVPVLSGVEATEKSKQPISAPLTPILEEKVPSAPEIKVQVEPKPETKQAADAPVKMAERLWAKQEKLKQAELSKAARADEASARNFTLQLMVLSKQASVNDILKKYPAMSSGIRVIKTLANGQEKFILEYGSYADAATANKARLSLPAEFRNAMVRKIK